MNRVGDETVTEQRAAEESCGAWSTESRNAAAGFPPLRDAPVMCCLARCSRGAGLLAGVLLLWATTLYDCPGDGVCVYLGNKHCSEIVDTFS